MKIFNNEISRSTVSGAVYMYIVGSYGRYKASYPYRSVVTRICTGLRAMPTFTLYVNHPRLCSSLPTINDQGIIHYKKLSVSVVTYVCRGLRASLAELSWPGRTDWPARVRGQV